VHGINVSRANPAVVGRRRGVVAPRNIRYPLPVIVTVSSATIGERVSRRTFSISLERTRKDLYATFSDLLVSFACCAAYRRWCACVPLAFRAILMTALMVLLRLANRIPLFAIDPLLSVCCCCGMTPAVVPRFLLTLVFSQKNRRCGGITHSGCSVVTG